MEQTNKSTISLYINYIGNKSCASTAKVSINNHFFKFTSLNKIKKGSIPHLQWHNVIFMIYIDTYLSETHSKNHAFLMRLIWVWHYLEGNDDGNGLPNMHEFHSLSVRRRQLWKVSLYTITERIVYSWLVSLRAQPIVQKQFIMASTGNNNLIFISFSKRTEFLARR